MGFRQFVDLCLTRGTTLLKKLPVLSHWHLKQNQMTSFEFLWEAKLFLCDGKFFVTAGDRGRLCLMVWIVLMCNKSSPQTYSWCMRCVMALTNMQQKCSHVLEYFKLIDQHNASSLRSVYVWWGFQFIYECIKTHLTTSYISWQHNKDNKYVFCSSEKPLRNRRRTGWWGRGGTAEINYVQELLIVNVLSSLKPFTTIE